MMRSIGMSLSPNNSVINAELVNNVEAKDLIRWRLISGCLRILMIKEESFDNFGANGMICVKSMVGRSSSEETNKWLFNISGNNWGAVLGSFNNLGKDCFSSS